MIALWFAAGPVLAQTDAIPVPPIPTDTCEVPGYILFDDSRLHRVGHAMQHDKRLHILVVGSGSSALPGTEGGKKSYPARLRAILHQRYPGVDIAVESVAKSRLSAADMLSSLDKVLLDRKPDLVIWQTGTVDAMRGVDPESFRVSLDKGVDLTRERGADVILMNMQYSPRTETMIALSNYADIMRYVARDRDVPLFNRREIMRYWNDNGNFDLNLATRDVAAAYSVHDCLARALASQIVEAAQLDGIKTGPTQ